MSLAFNAYFSSFKIGGHWHFLVFEYGLKICLTSVVYYCCHAELLQIRGVADIQFTRILFHYSLCTFTRIFTSGSTAFIPLSLLKVLSTGRSWKRALFYYVNILGEKTITSLLIEVNLIQIGIATLTAHFIKMLVFLRISSFSVTNCRGIIGAQIFVKLWRRACVHHHSYRLLGANNVTIYVMG